MDFDPLEIARQLTLIDQELLLSIFPNHLLSKISNSGQYCKSVTDYCNHFNKINAGFTSLFLETSNINERVLFLKHMIKVIHECVGLRNFGSAMSLLAAITSSPIYRLKHTWAKFSSKHPKSYHLHQQQTELLTPTNSYARLREKCDSFNGPQLVYLGMYLTDLTFLEDGNLTYLTPGVWNFAKIESIAAVLKNFMKIRKFRFNFSEVPVIKNFLLDLKTMTDREHYQRSLEIEPRGS
uniref:Ras-GEF domain-containing protein n=1 Tax=Arcella intermedia TaxID=1963864 RepID=A0A6B2LAW8_9EUKA